MASEELKITMTLVDKTKGALGGISSGLSSIGKIAIGTALGGLTTLAVQGVGRLVSGMGELAMQAPNLLGVEKAFNGIAEAAGLSGDAMLRTLQDSSKGMIDNTTLMQKFNLAAQLISPTFAQQLPDAMGYLQKVAGATGESMGYMLDSLVRGVGRMSPMILDNLGIQVDLVAANEAYAATLGKSVDEMTEAEQQTALMNQVMEKLKQNTASMPEVSNPFERLKTAITNIKESLVKGLIPIVLPFFEKLSTKISGFAADIQTMAGGIRTAFAGGVLDPEAINNMSSGAGKTLYANFTEVATRVGVFMRGEWKDSMLRIGQDSETYMGRAVTTILNAFQIAADEGPRYLLTVFEDNSSFIGGWLNDIFMIPEDIAYGIGNFIARVGQGILTIYDTVAPAFQFLWTQVKEVLFPAFVELWTAILKAFGGEGGGSAIQTFADLIASIVTWVAQYLVPAIAEFWLWLAEKLPPVIQALKAWISDTLVPAIATMVKWLQENVPIAMEAVAKFWEESLKPALEALWKWLSENLPPAIEKISKFWNEYLLPALKAVWEWLATNIPPAIEKLRQLWVEVLLPALQNFWTWMTTVLFPALSELWNWLTEKIGGAVAGLKKVWEENFLGIRTIFETTWENIKSYFAIFKAAIDGDWTEVGRILRDIWDRTWAAMRTIVSEGIEAVLGFIRSLGTRTREIDWMQLGKDIILGIVQGIQNMQSAVGEALVGILQAGIQIAQGFIQGHSPSELFAKVIGESIGSGIEIGTVRSLAGFPDALTNAISPQNVALAPAMTAVAPAYQMAGGGGWNGPFVYAPMISFADEVEAETKLAPIIRRVMRKGV